ncbi:MAG TPA: glycosyltransferase, partial [Solirubrobacteraceae bacterium]|nr:glycosyltransferase [Solirubrobacteraceae bacterium]
MSTVESNHETHAGEDSRHRVLQLERELRIRERDERAARREMGRLQTQLEQQARIAGQDTEAAGQIAQLRLEVRSACAWADDAHSQAESLGRECAQERSGRIVAERELVTQRERATALESEVRVLRAQLAEQAAELEQERRLAARLADELDDLHGELGAVRRQVDSADALRSRSVAEYAARVRRQQQTVSALAVGLGRVRDDIERASSSRAWRYGHGMTRVLARIAGRRRRTKGALAAALARIERIESETRGLSEARGDPRSLGRPGVSAGDVALEPLPGWQVYDEGLEPTAPVMPGGPPLSEEQLAMVRERRAALAARLRERLGPPPQRPHWPPVSAIVPTRNGLHYLRRLFASLVEFTDYPALEVVVVDNASTDGSRAFLDELDTPFPLRVIANDENLSFAEANAQGAECATGEVLLFLNNDVEAFEPGWLKEMVCALDVDGVA